MKTDQPIYLYLSAGPEAFRILTGGLTVTAPYRFESLTIKRIERRLDGIIEPAAGVGRVRRAWHSVITENKGLPRAVTRHPGAVCRATLR